MLPSLFASILPTFVSFFELFTTHLERVLVNERAMIHALKARSNSRNHSILFTLR